MLQQNKRTELYKVTTMTMPAFRKTLATFMIMATALSTSLVAAEKEKGSGLKNPELMDRYQPKNRHDWEFGEHLIINMFVGAFSGGMLGGTAGLSFYESDNVSDSQDKVLFYAAVLGAVGAGAGVGVTVYEYSNEEQFTTGVSLMRHSWYGALGGALAGSIVGLIPYSSSEDTDDILNFTGYGAAAGLAIGVSVFFFVSPKKNTSKIRWGSYYDPFRRSMNLNVTRYF